MFKLKIMLSLYIQSIFHGNSIPKCKRHYRKLLHLNQYSPASISSCDSSSDALRAVQNKTFTFSVAPMMEYTDCHQQAFHRLLSYESILYTGICYINYTDKLYSDIIVFFLN